MRLRSSRITWTGWQRTSADVAELLQRLGRSLSLQRMKGGRSFLMLRSGRMSMLLLPIENSLPIPIPALASSCCLGSVVAPLPPMEEITEEATFICEDLDGLLREADKERARELGEGSSNSVVCLPPRVGSQEWRRLNGIHWMCPGPGRR